MQYFEIVATYQTGCFCEKEKLPKSHPFAVGERIPFKHETRKLAESIGAYDIKFGIGHTATALLPTDCKHYSPQVIRFEAQIA